MKLVSLLQSVFWYTVICYCYPWLLLLYWPTDIESVYLYICTHLHSILPFCAWVFFSLDLPFHSWCEGNLIRSDKMLHRQPPSRDWGLIPFIHFNTQTLWQRTSTPLVPMDSPTTLHFYTITPTAGDLSVVLSHDLWLHFGSIIKMIFHINAWFEFIFSVFSSFHGSIVFPISCLKQCSHWQ